MEIVKKKINIILLILFISLTFIFFYINNKETFSLGGESTRERLRKEKKGRTKKGRKQMVENARARGTVLKGNKKSNTIGYRSNQSLSKKEVQSIARTLSSNKNITNMRSQLEKLERKQSGKFTLGKRVSILKKGLEAGALKNKSMSSVTKKFKESLTSNEERAKRAKRVEQISELKKHILQREAEQASLEGTNTKNITRNRLRTALNLGEAARSGELAKEENTRQKLKREAEEALLTDSAVESYKKEQNQFLTTAEVVSRQRSKVSNEISSAAKAGNRAVRGRDELISQEQKVKQEKEKLEQEQKKLEDLKFELKLLSSDMDLKLAAKSQEYKEMRDNEVKILKEQILEQEAKILEQKVIINDEREKLSGIADATKGKFVEYGKRRELQKRIMSNLNASAEQLRISREKMRNKKRALEGLNLTEGQIKGILNKQGETTAAFSQLMKKGQRVPQMNR